MRNAIAPKPATFASLVQQFFTEYLVSQRALSPRTVACYRDALMLFLDFASRRLGRAPIDMRLADLRPDLILAFLDHLEHNRHNAIRSRNLRLTALRAFLKFAGRRDVTSLHVVEQAMAVPMKHFEQPMLGYLTRQEMEAVLGKSGPLWSSQRDHLLLTMLYNTGARVSEIIGVRVVDVVLEGAACVHLHGKGRKLRSIPLWDTTVMEVRAWLRRNPTLRGETALLPNRYGQAMSRSNVAQRLHLAMVRAAKNEPGLLKKAISPHTLRHTTAMHLLQSSVPFNVIAVWLGHESMNTTHRYIEANLAMKEKALARLEPPNTKMGKFQAPDALMRFLQSL
ncbi:MAG: tyrosine-type recombinase/integrase [Hydrogenophaga sp.]|jgi:site-specific recombinase XerD|uniref:tyrosine-type recombinase/integrase n=1 Tax=Hydrogenophaga sp. TaxID=1904254 RepID=UPI0027243E24|nr:tyrosine-type recombinase/integrase [Hydrogenophaga sp.]MDO9571960.1 tyrosine-type recombinase/integrase [Hydrogenophaga sp.]MDP3924699.1 tyrosine-type recombinase/integrase [Hydrogenophaga sp.]